MSTVTLHDPGRGKYARVWLSPRQVARYDNGSLISTGLWVPEDIDERTFDRLAATGETMTKENADHSSCQSSCILRGDPKCQW